MLVPQQSDLSDNHISVLSFPAGWGNCTRLTGITLESNAITSIASGAFASLTILVGLYLKPNMITSLPSGLFAKGCSLTYLELSNNNIATISPDCFADLPQLSYLGLNNNNLSAVPAFPTALPAIDQLSVTGWGGERFG